MGIKLVGFEKLQAKLKKNTDLKDVKKIIKFYGAELEKKAKRNTENFKGHYEWEKGKGLVFVKPTGNLKRGINTEISDGGLTSTTESSVEYSGYVEYGTRYMEAQPYMHPAFKEVEPEFKRDLDKLVK